MSLARLSAMPRAHAFDLDAYRRAIDEIREHSGTPVIFQSYGLTSLEGERVIDAYRSIARHCSRFIAFELGTMFAPFGRIYELETFAGLLSVKECIGAKHSSLDRMLEWQRLQLARRAATGFPGAHGQRSRHRHGDVRQRLSPGLEHLCPGSVCSARCDVGDGRSGLLRVERPAPVPWLLRLPPAGAGL